MQETAENPDIRSAARIAAAVEGYTLHIHCSMCTFENWWETTANRDLGNNGSRRTFPGPNGEPVWLSAPYKRPQRDIEPDIVTWWMYWHYLDMSLDGPRFAGPRPADYHRYKQRVGPRGKAELLNASLREPFPDVIIKARPLPTPEGDPWIEVVIKDFSWGTAEEYVGELIAKLTSSPTNAKLMQGQSLLGRQLSEGQDAPASRRAGGRKSFPEDLLVPILLSEGHNMQKVRNTWESVWLPAGEKARGKKRGNEGLASPERTFRNAKELDIREVRELPKWARRLHEAFNKNNAPEDLKAS